MKLIYKQGDVTNPTESGNLFIIHCCNDIPCMGSGVALALMNKWPQVREEYMKWGEYGQSYDKSWVSDKFRLGEIQILDVKELDDDSFWCVVNMIGQRDVCYFEDMPPIRYEAIKECLWKIRRTIEGWRDNEGPINIVAPKFGSHLAGGDWNKIESIIHEVFDETDINFTVYSL